MPHDGHIAKPRSIHGIRHLNSPHTRTIRGTTPTDLIHIENRWDIPDCTIAFRSANPFAETNARLNARLNTRTAHSSESVPNDPPASTTLASSSCT